MLGLIAHRRATSPSKEEVSRKAKVKRKTCETGAQQKHVVRSFNKAPNKKYNSAFFTNRHANRRLEWNKKKSSESNPLRSSGGGNTICVEGCVPVQISVVPEEKKNMAVGSPAIIRGKVLDHERGESSKIDKNSELKN